MHALYVQECQLFSQVSIFWIAGPPLLIHLTNFVVIMFTNYQHNTANILCSSFNFLSQNKIKLKLNYTNTLWYWSYYVICSVFLESWFDFQVELYCHNPNRNSKSTIVYRSVKLTLIKGSCKNGISIFQPIFHPFTCEMKALDDSITLPPLVICRNTPWECILQTYSCVLTRLKLTWFLFVHPIDYSYG